MGILFQVAPRVRPGFERLNLVAKRAIEKVRIFAVSDGLLKAASRSSASSTLVNAVVILPSVSDIQTPCPQVARYVWIAC